MTLEKNAINKKIEIISPIVAITSEPPLTSFRHHQQILKLGSHRQSPYFLNRYQQILSLMQYFGFEPQSRDFMLELDNTSGRVPLMICLMRDDVVALGELKSSFIYLLDLERQHASAVLTGRSTTAAYLSAKVQKAIDMFNRHRYFCEFEAPKRITISKQSSGGKKGKYDRFWDSIIEPKIREYLGTSERTVDELRVGIEAEIKLADPNIRFGNGTKGFDELPKRTVEHWIKKIRHELRT